MCLKQHNLTNTLSTLRSQHAINDGTIVTNLKIWRPLLTRIVYDAVYICPYTYNFITILLSRKTVRDIYVNSSSPEVKINSVKVLMGCLLEAQITR